MMLTKTNRLSKAFHRSSSPWYGKSYYGKLGNFRLVSLDTGKVSKMESDAVKTLLKKILKKHAAFWLNFKPNLPVTKKPINSRLGKGKSKLYYWACKLQNGVPLIEIKGSNSIIILKALNKIRKQLSVRSNIQYNMNRWF
jgi:large subunit ribosomal protein L16